MPDVALDRPQLLDPGQREKVKAWLQDPNVSDDRKQRVKDTLRANYMTTPTAENPEGTPVTAEQVAAVPEPPGTTGTLAAGAPIIPQSIMGIPVPSFARGAEPKQLFKEVAGSALEAGAVALAPEMIAAPALDAPMLMRGVRNLARVVAAGTAGVGAGAARRKFVGEEPFDPRNMFMDTVFAAGPQVVAEIARPFVMTGRELKAVDDALAVTATETAEKATQTGLRAREARGESLGTQITAAATTAERQAAGEEVAAAGKTAFSEHQFGLRAQNASAQWEAKAAKKKTELYNREVAEATRLKLGTLDTAALADKAEAALEALATGLPEAQSAQVRKILNGVIDRTTTPVKTMAGATAAEAHVAVQRIPKTLSYAEADAIRRDLQPLVRRVSQRGGRETFQKGTLESVYGELNSVMDKMAAGTPVEDLALKADRYYRHGYVPARDAKGAMWATQEPASIMETILGAEHEDRLVQTMRSLDPETRTGLRSSLIQKWVDEATDPITRVFDHTKFVEHYHSLSGTQRKALFGSGHGDIPVLVETLRRKLADERIAGTTAEGVMEQTIRQMDDAAKAQSAVTGLPKPSQSEALTKTAVSTGMSLAGVWQIAHGNLWGGMAALLGAPSGSAAIAHSFATQEGRRALLKMFAVTPFTQRAGRVGTQWVATLLKDAGRPHVPVAPPGGPVAGLPTPAAPPPAAPPQ